MSDLGALLRKAREQRGLSLEDIQDLTKIRKRYLEAIEEGNYAVLPGSFYVRAFVKNYAENVGLDADEVLRLYQKEIPHAAPEPVVETVQRPRRAQAQSSDRWSRWGFRSLMWLFFILIVVIVYVFYINNPVNKKVDTADDETKITDEAKLPEENKDKTTPGTDGQTNTPDPGNVTPDPEPPVTPPATTVTFIRSTGKTNYYEVSPAAGTHKIELKVAGGSSWVGVSEKNVGGKYLLTQTLKDGESVSVDVTVPVYINIAHANMVEVTIDGAPIDDGNKKGSRKMQLDPAESTGTDTGTGQNTGTDTAGTDTSNSDAVTNQ
ncbi:helix-turn-helix domain-containing protein [Paenibacillus spongiae]|uniref:Helix-turn-helix domain-containing protein n=1 Tax=Paenibacillus spongiae TaxID=2909671 RepID=A0ABY5SJ82_9BACL|nr:RodZ family helix-turn-helix domain-containing protein [Paenibacillus spongiae]UVI32565.1 helix-turn-helix domain-containing protein [Paenibacillus spongiae]